MFTSSSRACIFFGWRNTIKNKHNSVAYTALSRPPHFVVSARYGVRHVVQFRICYVMRGGYVFLRELVMITNYRWSGYCSSLSKLFCELDVRDCLRPSSTLERGAFYVYPSVPHVVQRHNLTLGFRVCTSLIHNSVKVSICVVIRCIRQHAI